MDKKAMYNLTYGLFILTAKEGDKDNGCIVNTVSQVTTEPNRIVVAVNKKNYTHDMIVRTGVFNVSILTEKSKFDTYKHWGFQSGADVDKTETVIYQRAENGVIYIAEETNAFLSAKVVSSTDLGTHTLFLADVTDGAVFPAPSLCFDWHPPMSEEGKTRTGYCPDTAPIPSQTRVAIPAHHPDNIADNSCGTGCAEISFPPVWKSFVPAQVNPHPA